jgi:transposase
MYAKTGRPSMPPEHLLRAVLLQIFYSVRSERMLMERLTYNLLFRWFVGLEMDEPVWNHAVFSKNRERLLNQEVAREFFQRVLAQAKSYLSDEHFTVDGTLIEAWASQKSFQKKDDDRGAPGDDFTARSAAMRHMLARPIRTPVYIAGSAFGLRETCAAGESPRANRRCHADPCRWHGGAGCRLN